MMSAAILVLLLLASTGVLAEHCMAKPGDSSSTCSTEDGAEHPRLRFKAVKGLFVQEDKHKALTAPGQHPAFGAKKPWPTILSKLKPGRKLIHLIRHGEAVSNAVQAYVGNTAWDASVAAQCMFPNETSSELLQLYDPPLTARGQGQAAALHTLLRDGDLTVAKLTGERPFKVVVSPLSRTLDTFLGVLGDLVPANAVSVDEYCRERFGHNTCDARRPATPSGKGGSAPSAGLQEGETSGQAAQTPGSTAGGERMPQLSGEANLEVESASGARATARELLGHHDRKGKHEERSGIKQADASHRIACAADMPLAEKYPNISFPVLSEGNSGLGLVSDADTWWDSEKRESDKHLVRRTHLFLERVFREVQEDVVFVVTHSGAIGAILEAMGRESYSAVNAELVPVLVEQKKR